MKRRAFLSLLGCTTLAWPSAAWAQEPPMRIVGYLSPRSAEAESEFLTAFRRGLSETGHVEGKNLTIEYRWADGRYDQLPALAAELVRRQASVIITTGGPQPARAALAATSTIPIVFISGSDPVADGLVKSFNRPGGNATGVHVFTTSLGSKRLEFLHELVPKVEVIAAHPVLKRLFLGYVAIKRIGLARRYGRPDDRPYGIGVFSFGAADQHGIVPAKA
jgi:putative tryptophan/tyrosine transport system substrate-binding protein